MIQSEMVVLAGLAQAALPDTIVTVQYTSGFRAWIDTLGAIATIIIAITLPVFGLVMLGLALKFRKLIIHIERAAVRLRIDIQPALHNVISITENLNYLSKTVRKDAEQLSRTVNRANDRLNATIRAAEEKVGELNAVLGVVQDEAESLLIGTAASVRGVQAGADTFRRLQVESLLERERGDIEDLLDEELEDFYDDEDLEDFSGEDDLEDFDDDDDVDDDDDDGVDGVEVEYVFEEEEDEDEDGEDDGRDPRGGGIDPDRVF